MVTAHLTQIDLPEFGMPEEAPELSPALYRERLARLRAKAAERGLDAVLVYADREHSANLFYLSGFDPRFEEALLVVARSEERRVGKECRARWSLDHEKIIYSTCREIKA